MSDLGTTPTVSVVDCGGEDEARLTRLVEAVPTTEIHMGVPSADELLAIYEDEGAAAPPRRSVEAYDRTLRRGLRALYRARQAPAKPAPPPKRGGARAAPAPAPDEEDGGEPAAAAAPGAEGPSQNARFHSQCSRDRSDLGRVRLAKRLE